MTQLPTGAARAAVVGPYRLLEKIGEGGMGEVWLAEQVRPVHRQVAVKVIKAGMDTAQVVARFEAERQALALMDHPAIARVFDAGATVEGRPYFAMEFVRGEPITRYANRHKLSIRERIELLIQVCVGVQHAHQKGIIHRDLKPSNVLVTVRDDRPVLKIIDFGVAKATTQSLTERTLHTEIGALVGTPEYMSPEQAEMGGDIDTRTDVYALGVMLYELLTGALPFDGKMLRSQALDDIRRTIREKDPPRPSTRITTATEADGESGVDRARLSRALRGDLDWITMKALDKERTRRYATVGELAADLQRYMANLPVLAGPPSASYRMRKFVSRNRAAVVAAGTFVALLLAFAVAMTVQMSRISRERDRANVEASRANREADVATQVTNFLVGLFNVSDPSEARGNTLTAQQILDRGAAAIDKNLGNQPEVRARLQMAIGTVYTNLGRLSAAEPLLKQAAETMTKTSGAEDPSVLSTLSSLADLYWYQGRFHDAELLYRRIYEGRKHRLGDNHRSTMRAGFDLASALAGEDRFDDAEAIYRTVYEQQRRNLGEEDHDTVQTIGNLSSLYWARGRYAEALPLATRSYELQRKTSGPDHPATLEAMHNVATTYDRLGDFANAEAMYLATIEGKRRIQGEAHPSTLLTRLRFAQMRRRQGRFADAETQLSLAHDALTAAGANANRQRAQQVAEEYVSLYEAWNRPAQAAHWRTDLANIDAATPAPR
jgi:non-specific serine/threonine protein kinase/serine/threonine-protein kinase